MTLFAGEDRWLAFAPGEVREIKPFPALDEAVVVVCDPPRSVSGVARLEGNVRHAAVLIDRRLRQEGSVEGEAKVFIHHIERIGQGYQALYTALPLVEWQNLLAWATAQTQHCLLVSSVGLAWASRRPGELAVFHNAGRLTLVGQIGHQVLHLNTIAFSENSADMLVAVQALGERVREELLRLNVNAQNTSLSVCWLPVDLWGADTPKTVLEAFSQASGVAARCDGAALHDASHRAVLSAIPRMTRRSMARLALNPSGQKNLYIADRLLPVAAVASVALALGLLAMAVNLEMRSSVARAEAQTIEQRDARIRSQLGPTAPDAAADEAFSREIGFLEALQGIDAGPDPVDLLQSLKLAGQKQVRILGMRLEASPDGASPAKAARVIVDGMLAGEASQDSKALSAFVRALRGRGYQADPVDTAGAAASLSGSSRLFSYRLTRIAT